MNGRRCFVANDILYELVRTEAYRARFTVKRDGQKAVSYTHLDVYKRQLLNSSTFCGT